VSNIDWSRATITVRVPVVHTANETWQEIEVPWKYLVSDEGLRSAQRMRIGELLTRPRIEDLNGQKNETE
jgi:hypothetical protein